MFPNTALKKDDKIETHLLNQFETFSYSAFFEMLEMADTRLVRASAQWWAENKPKIVIFVIDCHRSWSYYVYLHQNVP